MDTDIPMEQDQVPSSVLSLSQNDLVRIFRHLETTDLRECTLVNKAWRNLIFRDVGISANIGQYRHLGTWRYGYSSHYYHNLQNPNDKYYTPELIGEIGISSCRVGNIHNNIQLVKFKYPGLVKSMLFDGEMSIPKWNLLVKPLANLSSLTVSQFMLLKVDFKNGDSHLTFPTLKTLIVTGKPSFFAGHGYTRKIKAAWGAMILSTCHLLRRSNCPLIHEVALQEYCVHSGKQEDLVVEELVKFIIKNKTSLKKVSVGLKGINFIKEINSRLETPIDAPKLTQELNGLTLSSFFVNNVRPGWKSKRTQQLLRLVLESPQNQLQHCTWKFDQHEVVHGFTPSIAMTNSLTLQSLEMILAPTQAEVNCEAFHNCNSLEILTLIRGSNKVRNEDGKLETIEQDTELTNVDHLPASLKQLRICGLKVKSTSLANVATMTLDKLELRDTGISEDFGLEMTSLQTIVQNQRINTISLKRCLKASTGEQDGFNQWIGSVILRCVQNGSEDFILQLDGDEYVKQGIRVNYERYYDTTLSSKLYSYEDERSEYFKNLTWQYPLKNTLHSPHSMISYSLVPLREEIDEMDGEDWAAHAYDPFAGAPLVEEDLEEEKEKSESSSDGSGSDTDESEPDDDGDGSGSGDESSTEADTDTD